MSATTTTAHAEGPILLREPQVKAILEGRMTVTRQLVKPQPVFREGCWGWETRCGSLTFSNHEFPAKGAKPCPYGQPGDVLWGRETFYCDHFEYPNGKVEDMRPLLEYRASHDCKTWEAGCPCRDDDGRSSWHSSVHMPRWASRITLRVTDVRAERLQSITLKEVEAEGVQIPVLEIGGPALIRVSGKYPPISYCGRNSSEEDLVRAYFASFWDEKNAKRPGASWNDDPWVWRVEFERIKP